jgi:drug/metabolite transporter (DMT)-like permease
MRAMGLTVPRGRALLGVLVYGALIFGGAFSFAYYALLRIHAGLAQTLLALVPLATLLFAVGYRQERLRVAAVGGTILSVAGIGVISEVSPRRRFSCGTFRPSTRSRPTRWGWP